MDGAKRREKGESDVRFELAPPAHEPLVPPSLLKVTHTYIFYPSLYPCHGNDWSTQVQPITSNVTNAGPNQTYIHSKQSYPLRLPAAQDGLAVGPQESTPMTTSLGETVVGIVSNEYIQFRWTRDRRRLRLGRGVTAYNRRDWLTGRAQSEIHGQTKVRPVLGAFDFGNYSLPSVDFKYNTYISSIQEKKRAIKQS